MKYLILIWSLLFFFRNFLVCVDSYCFFICKFIIFILCFLNFIFNAGSYWKTCFITWISILWINLTCDILFYLNVGISVADMGSIETEAVDPWCDPENPVKVQFDQVLDASEKIRDGIQKTPCTVSIQKAFTNFYHSFFSYSSLCNCLFLL